MPRRSQTPTPRRGRGGSPMKVPWSVGVPPDQGHDSAGRGRGRRARPAIPVEVGRRVIPHDLTVGRRDKDASVRLALKPVGDFFRDVT